MNPATRLRRVTTSRAARSSSAALSRSPRSTFQRTVSFIASARSWKSAPSSSANSRARSVWKASSAPARSGSASTTTAPRPVNTPRHVSTTARTSGSNGSPNPGHQATRRPARSPARGGPYVAPGSGSDHPTRGSGPAWTLSSKATSSTVRPIGPCTPSDGPSRPGTPGRLGTRPIEGRSPTTPQNDAGLRNEPPRSLPSARATIPQARAAAAPPLLPPADRARS